MAVSETVTDRTSRCKFCLRAALLPRGSSRARQDCSMLQKKLFTLLDLCVSSLRRGHANLFCIVPILTDDPRRQSGKHACLKHTRLASSRRFALACAAFVACSRLSTTSASPNPNLYLGRVTPLCAPSGSVADGVSWTAVRPVPHVDGLP